MKKSDKSSSSKFMSLFFSKKVNWLQISFVVIVLIAIFILVYSPHFSTPFPIHMDEWHSIEEALNINSGGYNIHSLSGFEFGFNLFLSFLGKFMNLIFTYKFFPAIWAVLSAIVLFFIVYNLSHKNFLISLASIIFFSSIKSNSNLTGMWFFIPLTFAIPFIFLYFFFFIKGLQTQKKKYLVISLLIMLFLVPIHAISILFAIPILIISCIFYFGYVKKEYKLFLLFLLIPILGIILYSFIMKTSLIGAFSGALNLVQFGKYWAGPDVPVFNNLFTDVYSLIGYAFAIIGSIFILIKKRKDLFSYIVWPVYLFISILLFRTINVSYFAPYPKTLYYLAIGLPILSAFGLGYSIELIRDEYKGKLKKFVNVFIIIFFLIVIIFTYISYYTPPAVGTNYIILITPFDYNELIYLSHFPKGIVIAPPIIIPIIRSISRQDVIGNYFDADYSSLTLENISRFYNTNDCAIKNSIIDKYNLTYVISGNAINCNYTLLLNDGHAFIYEVNKSTQ